MSRTRPMEMSPDANGSIEKALIVCPANVLWLVNNLVLTLLLARVTIAKGQTIIYTQPREQGASDQLACYSSICACDSPGRRPLTHSGIWPGIN